ncbi:MAG TPA: putative toxin-antitoxin system toxin component, PIN family [Pirellulales bacterium]|jgi:putative PIN family toxin of toxin-antitoxin system|nr:putative toxin-antitoxin system toxin component, PIN family [Pirellulales bacterium]
MSPEFRFVFDTSSTVSALLFEHSVPGKAYYTALDRGRLLISAATFSELADILGREKFDRYVSRSDREQFLVRLLREALLIDVSEVIQVCRDPTDDKFLELATCGGSSCIVTSDQDLLVLKSFRNIPLLTPAEFHQWIAGP